MKLKTYITLMASILMILPIFTLTVNAAEDDWEAPVAITSEDDWEAPNAITSEDDWEAPNAVVADGADTVAPTDDIVIGGWNSVVDDWEALPGNSEGIFSPGGFGLKGEAQDELSGFGLWWSGVKETVGLTFTFGAEKKAQKRLQYAEENLQMAAGLAGSDDPETQDKIEKLVGRAQKHMNKIENTQDKWFDENSEGSQELVGNIVRHNLNRELVMDGLEETAPEGRRERVREMRQDGREGGERLMNGLADENVPEDVRGYLQGAGEYLGGQAGGEAFFDVFRPNPAGDGDVDAASGLPTGKRQIEAEKEDSAYIQIGDITENSGYIQIGDVQPDVDEASAPPTEEVGPGTTQPNVGGAAGVSPDVIDPAVAPGARW
ncbi:hypothetical protein KJ742_05465 [Patescibacteria group bacterium]|nr:hypothetical protein [Patescibacteria group bacterium]MBU1683366.1 hypothetical protein [Patescibacteria group bacterium]MBU1934672.1 hypothetical protein [Patescibacteria group bacterium]